MQIETAVPESRTRESFLYSREITKPFGELDRVIAWCKTELLGDWRWELIQPSSDISPGKYQFYFDRDSDFCAFILKWQ